MLVAAPPAERPLQLHSLFRGPRAQEALPAAFSPHNALAPFARRDLFPYCPYVAQSDRVSLTVGVPLRTSARATLSLPPGPEAVPLHTSGAWAIKELLR
jgi:hypothetical protein